MNEWIINNVKINGFKSIKRQELGFKQVNVLIGKPDSGKTNLVEVFKLLWIIFNNSSLNNNVIRFSKITDLFHNKDKNAKISIELNGIEHITGKIDESQNIEFRLFFENKYVSTKRFDYNGKIIGKEEKERSNQVIENSIISKIRPYIFKDNFNMGSNSHGVKFLRPFYGENLFHLIYENASIRELIEAFSEEFGYELNFDLKNKEVLFEKRIGTHNVLFPFKIMPTTLKALIFYTVAIYSNSNNFLIFHDLGQSMFPVIAKRVSKIIARDSENQYLIVTHNPYVLLTLIEKTPTSKLAIFAGIKNREGTEFKLVSVEKIIEELDTDPFFNLDRYLF